MTEVQNPFKLNDVVTNPKDVESGQPRNESPLARLQALGERYGFQEISKRSAIALNTLAESAQTRPNTHDPFEDERKTDHRSRFGSPGIALFYYSTLDPKRREHFGRFSSWAIHKDEDNTGFGMDGNRWKTVEHAYMAHRFVGIRPDLYQEVAQARTPFEAKAIAHSHSNGMRPDWGEVKELAMLRSVLSSVREHDSIKMLLEGTGDAVIVEDAFSDSTWGRGPDFRGANMLGQTWMRARKIIGLTSPDQVQQIIQSTQFQ